MAAAARHPQRACSGRSRHGTAWLLSPCASLFPRCTSPQHQRGHASAQRPPPARFPDASLLHVSPSVPRPTAHGPPTECDRPNHMSFLHDYTRSLTLPPLRFLSMAGGQRSNQSHMSSGRILWASTKTGEIEPRYFLGSPRDRAHVVGTTLGINKSAAEADCPTGERHVCAARGLGDNTGVVVAVTINFLMGPRTLPTW